LADKVKKRHSKKIGGKECGPGKYLEKKLNLKSDFGDRLLFETRGSDLKKKPVSGCES